MSKKTIYNASSANFLMKWLKTANPNSQTVQISEPSPKEVKQEPQSPPQANTNDNEDEVTLIIHPAKFVHAVYNYNDEEEKLFYEEDDIDYIAYILDKTCEEMELYNEEPVVVVFKTPEMNPRKRPSAALREAENSGARKRLRLSQEEI